MTSFPPIEELLLHGGNMLLLAAVQDFSDDAVACRAVPEAGAWYDAGNGMPAWIGIELMAQAIAAHVSLLARRQGKPPRPGALLGTRSYSATVPAFAAGAALRVEARQTFRNADGLASYDCAIRSAEGDTLATAALTAYEPDDFEQFISGTQS